MLAVSGLKAGKLPRIVRRFSSLEVLNLSFLFDCSELCLSAIGRNCSNLQELLLPETTSKPAVNVGSGVTVLARGCSRLRTLSLPAYRGPTEALNNIAMHLTSLQCLRLRAASGLNDSVVQEIARNCIGLTELDLSFNNITDESLRAIGASLASLANLDLKHCRKVTGAGVAAVAAGCRMLKTLHLGVVGINDEGLEALGQNSVHLHELYLDYGTAEAGQISGEAMRALARGCVELQVLSLRGSKQVDNHTLAGLLPRGCPSLHHLDMHACTAVGDAGLHAVVAGCKELRQLVLSGTSVGAASIDARLPRLEVLRLNEDKVSDALLRSIGQNCPHLRELHLSNCQITDEGLAHVLRGCPLLHCLAIKSCPDLFGTAFHAVKCSALENLSLPACGVTDEGFSAMVDACPNLHSLSLPTCTKLSPDGVTAALANCQSLREITLTGCTQFDREDILLFTRAALPVLRTLRVSRPDCPNDEYRLSRAHVGWQLPSWTRSNSYGRSSFPMPMSP